MSHHWGKYNNVLHNNFFNNEEFVNYLHWYFPIKCMQQLNMLQLTVEHCHMRHACGRTKRSLIVDDHKNLIISGSGAYLLELCRYTFHSVFTAFGIWMTKNILGILPGQMLTISTYDCIHL